MNHLPIIGITTFGRNDAGEFWLPATYIQAIQSAGGIPVLLPPHQMAVEPLLATLDGLVFSGGGDLDPALYGGERHPAVYLVDPERDQFELALARAALAASVPTLGVCRGLQVLVVASGGTLVSHVPESYGNLVQHRQENPSGVISHGVQIQAGSRLASILGATTLSVISWHHQAAHRVPPEWTVTAIAADGVVEALEHRHHPWLLALQWHPEMSSRETVHPRLFQALVQAARQYRCGEDVLCA